MKKTSKVILLAFFFVCVCSIPAFAGTLPSSIGASAQLPVGDNSLALLGEVNDAALASVEGAQILDPVTGEPPETQVRVIDTPHAGDLLIGTCVFGSDGQWHVVTMVLIGADGVIRVYGRDSNGKLILLRQWPM